MTEAAGYDDVPLSTPCRCGLGLPHNLAAHYFDPPRRSMVCPTRTPEVHDLGEFPMSCYRCHVEADS